MTQSHPENSLQTLRLPNEPSRMTAKDVERVLLWATEQGASDITIQSGEQLFLEIHGKKYRATDRRLTYSEVMDWVTHMFGSESVKGTLSGDSDLDFAYEIKPDRSTRYRFRVNATPINVEGGQGVEITCRTIHSKPPTLDSLKLERELLESFAPKQGMVIVAGGTGSGKSTLLAAIIRHLAEDPVGHRKILTYEDPIEYVYDEIIKPTTSIAQCEIRKNLKTFVAGTRNALRRKPDIILLGEARDAETIGEAVTASMTGHCLYTTVHANGFADTVRRMVNVFPEGEKNARAVDILSSLRLVIAQRLVPSTDGKRVALREFVVMTDTIVNRILDAGLGFITASCRDVLLEHGRSFLQDAEEKFAAGRIAEKTYREIARHASATAKDIEEELAKSSAKTAELSSRLLSGSAAVSP